MENKYSALLELLQNLDTTTRLAYRSFILSYLRMYLVPDFKQRGGCTPAS